MKSVTGGCLCGNVRYECRGDELMVAVCHCRNCQKQAGSAFSVIVGYPRDNAITVARCSSYRDVAGESVLRQ